MAFNYETINVTCSEAHKSLTFWHKHLFGNSEAVCICCMPTDRQTLEVTVLVVKVRDGAFEAEGKTNKNIMKLSLTEFAVQAAL